MNTIASDSAPALGSVFLRCVAHVIDQALIVMMMVVAFKLHQKGVSIPLASLPVVALLGMQAYGLVRLRQSIGKFLLNLRIHRLDHAPAEPWRLLLLRLPAVLITTSVFLPFDFLTTMRADQRSIHDLVAGTIVVTTRPARPDSTLAPPAIAVRPLGELKRFAALLGVVVLAVISIAAQHLPKGDRVAQPQARQQVEN